jgi:Ser/Thr protein kinase RdoA (MazF antagonist)
MIDEPGLVQAAESFADRRLRAVGWLDGGDEALVLCLDGGGSRFVLHASPPWRTLAELEWVHAVVRHARGAVPQAVVPLERGGRTVFEWEDRCVALFPFIDGTMLDRESASRAGKGRARASSER